MEEQRKGRSTWDLDRPVPRVDDQKMDGPLRLDEDQNEEICFLQSVKRNEAGYERRMRRTELSTGAIALSCRVEHWRDEMVEGEVEVPQILHLRV